MTTLSKPVWCSNGSTKTPLPKEDIGKFYDGDCYIILYTYHSDNTWKGIHFWIGKDTIQDKAGKAAIKTVELDAVLGGRTVQRRVIQGLESEKFLSYFEPCIIPLEGGVASGFTKPEEEQFETWLYVCRGKRVVMLKQVPH